MIETPSAPSAPLTRPAMICAVCATAATSAGSSEWMSSAWARGITSTCPSQAGKMSRNATVRSSSWTRSAGIVPAAMPQKMQSLMASKDTVRPAPAPR